VLYGINLAKNSIITNDNCFLVEGYTDVISLHMAGIENVVSSSGTSLTTDQIRLISRYTKNISILYDGDAAGIKASFRGIDMILEQGMDVKIVLFPEGEDPDSFARSHRSIEVQEFIKTEAHNFIFFKTNLLIKDAENDPVKKVGLIKEIVGTIALIPDQITRSVYVKECSTLLDITEQTLLNELNKIRRKNFDKKLKERSREDDFPATIEPHIFEAENNIEVDYFSLEPREEAVIYFLIRYGNNLINIRYKDKDENEKSEDVDIASFIVSDLLNDEISFSNSVYQKIFTEIIDELKKGNLPDEKFFFTNSDKDIFSVATNLLIPKYELSDWEGRAKITIKGEQTNLKDSVERAILKLKIRLVERKFEENKQALKELTDYSSIKLILSTQEKLNFKKKIIAAKLSMHVLK
jgi:DNA primase